MAGWSHRCHLGMVAFIPALQLTSVSNVAIIIATGPFVAAAMAWIWLREVAGWRTLLAAGVALVGVASSSAMPAAAPISSGSRWRAS